MPETKVLAFYDRDGDGAYDSHAIDQGVEGPYDCDDADNTRFPGNPEVCNGVDDDCNDLVDDGSGAPTTYFVDSDADGFGSDTTEAACARGTTQAEQPGDCDDTNNAIYPGAADIPYDGIDADCTEDDDNDADHDGFAAKNHGGQDCNDADNAVYPNAPEGWFDLGVDNDCDDSIDDQVVLDLASVPRIDGPEANAGFGSSITRFPAGYVMSEPAFLVSAPGAANGDGVVYFWSEKELFSAHDTSSAVVSIAGPERALSPFGGSFGYAAGYAGASDHPVVLISAVGANGGEGAVFGWVDEPPVATSGSTFTVRGPNTSTFVGGAILSGVDLDGDGLAELVLSALLDSRVSSNGGSVAVFDEPWTLVGDVPYDDADRMFTTTVGGARIRPLAVGDIDGNGTVDLGFGVTPPTPGIGAHILFQPGIGDHDVPTEADISFQYCCDGFTLKDVTDDGEPELIALGGPAYALPRSVRGTVNVTEQALFSVGFANAEYGLSDAGFSPFGWRGPTFFAISTTHSNDRGALRATRFDEDSPQFIDDAQLTVNGERAGDRFGSALEFRMDDDDSVDLVVGASRYDASGADAGAVYLLEGPD